MRFTGGIGNQMFQYVAARRLAYIRKAELKLDIDWFSGITAIDKARRYELHVFCIQENFILSGDVKKLRQVDRKIFQKITMKLMALFPLRP